MSMNINTRLLEMCDVEYQAFQARLIPNIAPETIIGVRMPELRKLAKELRDTDEAASFLQQMPHSSLEENTLHGLLIAMIREPEACLAALDGFLPYVDNWMTCDVISPVCFKKHPDSLLPKVREWMASGHTYTIRFGIKTLMNDYLEDPYFSPQYPKWVAAVDLEEYYVRMMIAWYFATALAKQPEVILPYIESHRLSPWIQNKTIQKARESNRISPEMKEYLKTLKISAPE